MRQPKNTTKNYSRSNDRGEIAERPWRVPLAQSEVPATGVHLDLVADEQVRSRIAKLVGLLEVPRLSASFDISPHGRGGLHVRGRVSAAVCQTCVVTLEPIENEVDEAIDLVFLPDTAQLRAQTPGELEVPLEDEPEALVNGTVDLGSLVAEFLMLGIDPYPRRPGAAFELPREEDVVAGPFAALAKLSKRHRGQEPSS